MALGASHTEILKWILQRGVVFAAIGGAAGVVVSAAVSAMMASLLFGVRSHDPLVFVIVPIILLAVGTLASYLPALRAAKLDPFVALRET